MVGFCFCCFVFCAFRFCSQSLDGRRRREEVPLSVLLFREGRGHSQCVEQPAGGAIFVLVILQSFMLLVFCRNPLFSRQTSPSLAQAGLKAWGMLGATKAGLQIMLCFVVFVVCLCSLWKLAWEGGILWRFALLFAKSDEDARCNEFGLVHYSSAGEVCSECLCNRSNRPFTDLRPGALWRPTERMGFEVYKSRCRSPPHPLVDSPLFCHRMFFILDLMHLVDCNGVAALVFGSTLMMLVRDARLGSNQQDRLS